MSAASLRTPSRHMPIQWQRLVVTAGEGRYHDSALGTRHRAALGLGKRSDALVLAVSEERGTISVASGGELRTLAPSETLRADLAAFLKARVPPSPCGRGTGF